MVEMSTTDRYIVEENSSLQDGFVMNSARFQFYEVVWVNTNLNMNKPGVILGMAQNENGEWSYAVNLPDFKETWSVQEKDIESTGTIMQASDFYDGTKMVVFVDKEGKGSIEFIS